MNHSILALAAGAVLLSACAAQPGSEFVRRDDAYIPMGSNIPRKDRKPEETVSAPLPPGSMVSGPRPSSSPR